ncbi:hypothetical protein [Aliivibrio fischeri]|nr:hypothetical protein [Aliivibrio fischeri]
MRYGENMRETQLVYALYGASNTGKTTSLKYLTKKLEEVAIPCYHTPIDDDFCVSFIIKGMKVGIISGGDNRQIIESGLEKINDGKNCDIIFCAARTRGQTTHYLMDIFKKNELRWVANMHVTNKCDKEIDLCCLSVSDFLYKTLLLEIRA